MTKSLYFITIFLFPSIVLGGELKPLTMDGCSVFPDGTIEHQSLWADCCLKHDIAYWQGGTYNERLKADKSLQHCVAKVGEPEIAKIMLAGVRIGGSPYFPTNYRWGYGWPYPRGYNALSEEEKREVINRLNYLELLIKTISKELTQ
ncbi:MAG: FAD-binding oxidoreductase [Pseudomonadota bacterium]